MKVAFRVDASVRIGTGHVMRCLALAAWLAGKGAQSRFLCRQHAGSMVEFIRREGHEVVVLPSPGGGPGVSHDANSIPDEDYVAWLGVSIAEDAKQSAECLSAWAPDWLVVDHYALDANWESLVRPTVGRILSIDDLANRAHDCDLLLDQTFGRTPGDYDGLVPPACAQLLGPSYALLRPEFSQNRPGSLQRRQDGVARRILVTMGGIDLPNMTTKVLKALPGTALPKDWRLEVVLGPDAPALKQVCNEAASLMFPVTLHVGTSEMARLMASSDFAIGAAGSTVWERCCMGLPGIVFALAANQQKIAAELVAAGCSLNGSLDRLTGEISLKESVAEMLRADTLYVMSQKASEICDGMGTARIGTRMLDEQEHHRIG